jgi:hypothetical protein
MIRLERRPAGQVGSSSVLWKALAVYGQYRVVQLETEKTEFVTLDETGDLPQGHSLLLNMEKKIATAAEAQEILRFQNRGVSTSISASNQVLTKTADIFRAAAPLRETRPRCQDWTPRHLAIEAQQHESARPQQRQQRDPTGPGIGKVMQRAHAFNEIKLASTCLKLENVCLGVSDRQSKRLGLAPRIAKAGKTEIHRQHMLRAKSASHGDGTLPGAAACDQDIPQDTRTPGTFEPGERKFASQMASDGAGCSRCRPHPARVGIFLILILHQPRYGVFDLGQTRNIRAQAQFTERFATAASGCEPIDVFGEGVASPSGIAYATGNIRTSRT